MEEKKQLQKEVTSSEMIKPLNQNQIHRQAFLLGQSIQAVQRTDEQPQKEVTSSEIKKNNRKKIITNFSTDISIVNSCHQTVDASFPEQD